MSWARAVLALVAVVAAGALLVSGGSGADPRTPAGLPGEPPPFLGTSVVGSGGLTAAIDAYGDVVDLRAPGPAGRPLIDLSAARQAAGSVPADTGIVPWVSVDGRPPRPLWTADSVTQHYRPGTNVLVTTARFGSSQFHIVYAAAGGRLACLTERRGSMQVELRSDEASAVQTLHCSDTAARRAIVASARGDRRWLARAKPLAADAPPWASRMYRRSLLVLRALTDRRTGAVAAGARNGWAYVWPRDAATVALAFATAGYRSEARRVTRFLLGLELETAARFYGDGQPVPGRGPQGDASGWVTAAARATGLPAPPPLPWRNRADYREGEPGDYLANALASRADVSDFTPHIEGRKSDTPLVRVAGDPGSGLDSAAAWAVRPFSRPDLYPAVRATLRRLVSRGTAFGFTPSEDWTGGRDPWTAPTAWTAWSLAALSREGDGSRQAKKDRPLALRLLADLRRDATPTGTLPERVDYRTGIPTSTTPLAWSHAFAILALRELWPTRTASNFRSGR